MRSAANVLTAGVVSALTVAVLALPATAKTTKTRVRTHAAKFHCASTGPPAGATAPVSTTCAGTPLGSLKAKVVVAFPDITYTFTLAKGTMTIAGVEGLTPQGTIKGTWKVIKGTAHYAHATGRGTMTRALTVGTPFQFTGSFRF
jgi:hypothetical protein